MREETRLILASASASRAKILNGAGLAFEIVPADIDESAVRDTLRAGGESLDPADVADVLARTKAESVSAKHPGVLVIGADQVLALDGAIMSKPADMAEARASLLKLQGRTHDLHAAVCVAEHGDTQWAHTDTASLTMRSLSPETVGRYLAAAGERALGSVGAYQIEALGIHLFSAMRGDYFTILGLPLLPLLEYLRERGGIAA